MMRKFLLVILLVASQPCIAKHSLKQSQQALKQLGGKIQSLQQDLTKNKSQRDSLFQSLKKSEKNISQVSVQLAKINKEYQKEQQELAVMNRNQAHYQKEFNEQQVSLNRQLLAIYQSGQFQWVQMVLNQKDPSKLNRYLVYYQYLAKARLKLMKQMHASIEKIEQSKQVIAAHHQTVSKLIQEKKSQQQKLKKSQKSREQILHALNHSIKSKQSQLKNLVADKSRLQTLIHHLSLNAIKAAHSIRLQKGKLTWPVKGKIIKQFALAETVLPGVLIKASENASVHAVFGGKVIFADWLRGYGLLMIVDHGNGYMSLYGRNHNLLKKVGQTVQKGDVIASVGRTGGFSKTALYFELRHKNSPLNPTSWCHS